MVKLGGTYLSMHAFVHECVCGGGVRVGEALCVRRQALYMHTYINPFLEFSTTFFRGDTQDAFVSQAFLYAPERAVVHPLQNAESVM